MKKQFLLLSLFLFATLTTWAERIDVATARKVAQHVATQQAGSGLRSADDLSVVYAAAPGKQAALRSFADEGDADYFVFNVGNNRGFVIVSGEDRVRPVLGYADKGTFDPDNLPDNMRAWLANYQEQISWAADHLDTASPEISAEWSRYLSGASLRAENGVLLETADWDQGNPYNKLTPYVSGRGQAPTGCVATAMGIIMKYYNWPNEANADNRVTNYKGKEVTYTTYNWNNMLSSYTAGNYTDEQANEVAQLLWHCGANANMRYGAEESSAYIYDAAKALSQVFGYPNTRIVAQEGRTDAEWNNMMKSQLGEKRPILYSIKSYDSGHAVVIDGYQSDLSTLYHVNWGWGGACNGYYSLNLLDPNKTGNLYHTDMMLVDVVPNPTTHEVNKQLRLTLSLGGKATVSYQYTEVSIYAYFLNESAEKFEGYLCLAKKVGSAFELLTETQQEISLPACYSFNPYTLSLYKYSDDLIKEGDEIIVVYSKNGTAWIQLDGDSADGIKPYITASSSSYPPEDGPSEVNFSVKECKDGFENNYLGVGVNNEKLMIYSTVSNKCVRFRYTLSDPTWWDKVDMYYLNCPDQPLPSQTYDKKSLVFNEKGVAETDNMFYPVNTIVDKDLGLCDYYFHQIGISAKQAGYLDYRVEVIAEDGTLLGKFNNTRCVINPVQITITPTKIEGGQNQLIHFAVKVNETQDPLLANEQFSLQIGVTGTNASPNITRHAISNTIPSWKMTMTKNTCTVNGQLKDCYKGHIGRYFNFPTYGDWDFDFTAMFSQTLDAENIVVELYKKHDIVQNGVSMVADQPIPVIGEVADLRIVRSYAINMGLTHLTTDAEMYYDNVFYVAEHSECAFKLIPEEGYSLPTSIKITDDNTNPISNYTYNAETGEVVINSVDGNLHISASAVEGTPEPSYFEVVGSLTNLTADPDITTAQTVQEGSSFEFTLKAADNYRLPEAIIILDGETPLTAGTDYTYDNATGKVTITTVKANLQIKAQGIDNQDVQVVFDLAGVIADPQSVGPFKINTKPTFTVNFKAAEGYTYDDQITVKMGDKELTAGTDYVYVADNDAFELKVNLTATLTITAKATKNSYAVTTSLENLTASEVSKVEHGEPLTVTLTPETGYNLPETITVAMSDEVLADDAFVYDKAAGTIKIAKVTGQITIKAVGVLKQYLVQVDLAGLTTEFVSGTEVNHGSKWSITLTPTDKYLLPESITIQQDGKDLESSAYTYDAQTGKVTIAQILGNIVVFAQGVEKPIYTVALTATGIQSPDLPESIMQGKAFEVTLKAKEGYTLPATVSVKMGEKELTTSEYAYDPQTGALKIAQVTGNLSITLKAVPNTYTLSVELTNCTADVTDGAEITHDQSLTIQLKADEDYSLPSTITVVMEGDYTYDPSTGTLEIAKVTGDIKVTVVALKNQVIDPDQPDEPIKIEDDGQYELIKETPELTVTGATVELKATEESTVKKLTNGGATTIIGTAKVTIDGNVENTGTLTISEETNVTVTGTITNNGVFEDWSGKSTKVASGTGVSMEITNKPAGSTSYEKGKSLTLTVSVEVEEGRTPYFRWQKLVNGDWTDLEISSNLRSTTETRQYTVQNDNAGSYRCVITVAKDGGKRTVLVAKTTVKVTTPPVNPTPTPDDPTPVDPVVTYTVTLPVVEGALIEAIGSTTVTAGNNFSFTITVKEGYDATNMVVKANGTTLTPDASGRYTITNVSSNVIVTVTGLVSATANETLEAQAIKVWTTNGQVHIFLPQDSKVQVVTFSGRLYQSIELPAGETVMPLPQGAYIIRIGETSYKVVL